MLRKLVWGLPLMGLLACGQGQHSTANGSDLSIYGGTKVTQSDPAAKFTVLLMQNNRTVCSGVLLSKRLVLTAGHCFYLISKGSPAYVGFGLKDESALQIPVANFVPNADFNSEAGKLGGIDIEVNDVSLIKIAADAPAGYEPIEMLTQADTLAEKEPVLLAGFGKTDVKTGFFGLSTVVGELYQVPTELLFEAPLAKEVWLGNVPGKGACNGDSGGPAVVQREGGLKLLGVTSRGRDCRSQYIYTDVRYFQDWIAQTAASFGS